MAVATLCVPFRLTQSQLIAILTVGQGDMMLELPWSPERMFVIAATPLALIASLRAASTVQLDVSEKTDASAPLIGVVAVATISSALVALPKSDFYAAKLAVLICMGAFLSAIDVRYHAIPVAPVYGFGGFGFGFVVWEMGAGELPSVLLLSLAAWLALRVLARIFLLLRGREGLGSGDALILGALGPWLGVEHLAWALLVGAVLTIGYAVATADRGTGGALPFAPGLMIGAVVTLSFVSMSGGKV